jgi:hypothetical protein
VVFESELGSSKAEKCRPFLPAVDVKASFCERESLVGGLLDEMELEKRGKWLDGRGV